MNLRRFILGLGVRLSAAREAERRASLASVGVYAVSGGLGVDAIAGDDGDRKGLGRACNALSLQLSNPTIKSIAGGKTHEPLRV